MKFQEGDLVTLESKSDGRIYRVGEVGTSENGQAWWRGHIVFDVGGMSLQTKTTNKFNMDVFKTVDEDHIASLIGQLIIISKSF